MSNEEQDNGGVKVKDKANRRLIAIAFSRELTFHVKHLKGILDLLPSDTYFIHAFLDNQTFNNIFLFSHDSFDEVPMGGIVPAKFVIIEKFGNNEFKYSFDKQ